MSISHNLCKGCARGTDGVLRKSDAKGRRNEGEISNQHNFEEFYVNNLTTEDAAPHSITLYLYSPQFHIFSTPHLLRSSPQLFNCCRGVGLLARINSSPHLHISTSPHLLIY